MIETLEILMPAHNEAKSLAKLIPEIDKNINGKINYSIIICEDGSTDNTLESLAELKTSEPKFDIISYNANKGRGYALRRGFEKAEGNYILATESDMNYGVEIINISVIPDSINVDKG